jgi:polyphosphate kinase 2 (PPK2 family)
VSHTALSDDESLRKRLEADLIDSYDEEVELELEDNFNMDGTGITGSADPEARTARQTYFREIFRLQGELVKLQDSGRRHGAEGRDPLRGPRCGGQGGAIKRITQRLNPRDRPRGGTARAQQTANARSGISSAMSPICRPAGEIVLFDRSLVQPRRGWSG